MCALTIDLTVDEMAIEPELRRMGYGSIFDFWVRTVKYDRDTLGDMWCLLIKAVHTETQGDLTLVTPEMMQRIVAKIEAETKPSVEPRLPLSSDTPENQSRH